MSQFNPVGTPEDAKAAEAKARGNYLAADEVAMFCEQVALILKSGIPMYDGIEALCENYHDTRYAPIFGKINKAVKDTGNLAAAVEAAEIFPPYMVHMVRIGETTGKLDDVMEALGVYYERDSKLKASIRSAIVYPVVLVLMMAVVIGVLVSQVLPIFERVFRNLGTEMDASMTAVMNAGMIIGNVVLVIVAALIVILAIGFIVSKLGRAQQVNRLIFKIFPPIRRVMEKTSSGRFASVLSMMITAGFPISEAIALTPNVLSDDKTRAKVQRCSQALNDEGMELPKAIAAAELFEPIYNKMIQVGFYAGQMDRVMKRLSEIYEEEIDDGIRRLVGIIEPSLVALLAVVIGGILLAVMLPLASIMSSIL